LAVKPHEISNFFEISGVFTAKTIARMQKVFQDINILNQSKEFNNFI